MSDAAQQKLDASPTAGLILERAAELFAKKGFAATSIREIAEAVGVTKPTLYYHFESKEGLIREIVVSCMKGFREGIELSGGDIESMLRQLARTHVEFARTHPSMVHLMCRIQHQAPEALEDELEQMRIESFAHLTGLFAGAIERGELVDVDPRLLSIQYLGGLVMLFTALLRNRLDDKTPDVLANELVDLFFLGARPRKVAK